VESCKTIVFDFDGVIHDYKGPWEAPDIIEGEPVEGIKEAIADIRKAGYFVSVVSVRCSHLGGATGIASWLIQHDIHVDHISSAKPHALCYIDDRAICFDGHADSLLDKINNFTPWNNLTI
jgi:beta-phosphoglucomutase-like phosphatase (HAD superfamily)